MNALFKAAVLNGVGAALLGVLLLAAAAWSKNPFFVRGLCLVVLLKLVTPPLFGVEAPEWVSDLLPAASKEALSEPSDETGSRNGLSTESSSQESLALAESAALAAANSSVDAGWNGDYDDGQEMLPPSSALRAPSPPRGGRRDGGCCLRIGNCISGKIGGGDSGNGDSGCIFERRSDESGRNAADRNLVRRILRRFVAGGSARCVFHCAFLGESTFAADSFFASGDRRGRGTGCSSCVGAWAGERASNANRRCRVQSAGVVSRPAAGRA